jgi:hypothetical protein
MGNQLYGRTNMKLKTIAKHFKMRRLPLLFTLFSALATAATNYTLPVVIGFSPANVTTINTTALSLATTVDSSASSLALKQLSGTNTVGAYCTGSCTTFSNWTQTTTTVYGMALVLASAGGEFSRASPTMIPTIASIPLPKFGGAVSGGAQEASK